MKIIITRRRILGDYYQTIWSTAPRSVIRQPPSTICGKSKTPAQPSIQLHMAECMCTTYSRRRFTVNLFEVEELDGYTYAYQLVTGTASCYINYLPTFPHGKTKCQPASQSNQDNSCYQATFFQLPSMVKALDCSRGRNGASHMRSTNSKTYEKRCKAI